MKNGNNTEPIKKPQSYEDVSDELYEKLKLGTAIVQDEKHRINPHISLKNYEYISELMKDGELINMRLSKGAIIDLAITNLRMCLESGESLKNIAINHLEYTMD